jgi:hypothetical protein
MIDMKRETVVRALDVPNLDWIPQRRPGAKLSPQTVLRWVRDGLHGIKLERCVIGNVVYTSEEALHRFFERLSNPPVKVTPAESRRRSHDRAARQLADAGM